MPRPSFAACALLCAVLSAVSCAESPESAPVEVEQAASSSGPRPWAIEEIVQSGGGIDLLDGGDLFLAEGDPTVAAELAEGIWTTLTAASLWVADDPAVTFAFERVDGAPAPAPAYRHAGDVTAAGIVLEPPPHLGVGTYVSPSGAVFDAIVLGTWDEDAWELIVIESSTSFLHAHQRPDGLPLVQMYRAR